MIRIRVDRPAREPVDPADLRTHELATLQALGNEIGRPLDERQVLERALTCLLEREPFEAGVAYRTVAGDPDAIATATRSRERPPLLDAPSARSDAVPDAAPDVGPETAALRGHVRDAIATGEPSLRDGWWAVPLERRAALALRVADGRDEVAAEFLRTVAVLIASGLKRAALHARLAEKERQRARLIGALLTAQEEERGRISRDLHDQIGQSLTGLLLGLDAAIEQPDRVELARLKDLTSATLGDVRRIALDLRPSVLDALGLDAAVRRFARELHERHGLETQVAIHLPRLSSVEETVLYRVCQEALTNVVRHARATSVSVVATAGERQIQLVVEDDGTGFDPSALAPADEVGIVGMRERLQLLGGTLGIETVLGRGTTVHARLPRRAG